MGSLLLLLGTRIPVLGVWAAQRGVTAQKGIGPPKHMECVKITGLGHSVHAGGRCEAATCETLELGIIKSLDSMKAEASFVITIIILSLHPLEMDSM